MTQTAAPRATGARGRGLLARVVRRVSGQQVDEDLLAVWVRLDALEASVARLQSGAAQQATLVRLAELHGDAMQRIGDELVAARRLLQVNREHD